MEPLEFVLKSGLWQCGTVGWFHYLHGTPGALIKKLVVAQWAGFAMHVKSQELVAMQRAAVTTETTTFHLKRKIML